MNEEKQVQCAEELKPTGTEQVEKQWFYAAEFEAQEAWLSFMHQEGWALTKILGRKYHFTACEKEETVYRMEFREEETVAEDYLQLYRDFGWEYVTKKGPWVYFCKAKHLVDGGESRPEELELFSDSATRMAMIERMIRAKVRRLIPWGLLLLLYEFVVFNTTLLKGFGPLSTVFTVIALLGLVVAAGGFWLYVNQLNRLYRLKEKLKGV